MARNGLKRVRPLPGDRPKASGERNGSASVVLRKLLRPRLRRRKPRQRHNPLLLLQALVSCQLHLASPKRGSVLLFLPRRIARPTGLAEYARIPRRARRNMIAQVLVAYQCRMPTPPPELQRQVHLERAGRGEEKENVIVPVPPVPLERAKGRARTAKTGPVLSVLVLERTNLAFGGLRRESATTGRTVHLLMGTFQAQLRKRRPKPRRLRPALRFAPDQKA